MQSNHRAHKSCKIHRQIHIIGLNKHRADKSLHIQIGQFVEDILQIVVDLIVDRHLSVNDFLQVRANFFETTDKRVQTRHFLLDLFGEGAGGRVIDISQQVFHSHPFCFFSLYATRNVLEHSLNLLPLSLNLCHRFISCSGHFRHTWSHIDNNEHRLRAELAEELVNLQIVGFDFGARAIKSHYIFACVDFLEHPKHCFQEIVI
mmetsp:Transcript_21835/g.36801  ORF Transcript_21835/g.36801 Transcript_21835/m.36801 type:complete len:204 (+) Transcript_21835:404-1015(+)